MLLKNVSFFLSSWATIGSSPDKMYTAVSGVFTGTDKICFINFFWYGFN